MTRGIDPGVLFDPVCLMRQIWFTTPKRIHGIWHFDMPNQLLFMGYECQDCNEIFLVPDSVNDVNGLHEAMRHKCSEDVENAPESHAKP
jgi:hypothetical protein